LCHRSVLRTKKDAILKALEGKYTQAGLFALKQAYDGHMFYLKQIEECDRQIDIVINRIGDSGNGQDVKKKAKSNPAS